MENLAIIHNLKAIRDLFKATREDGNAQNVWRSERSSGKNALRVHFSGLRWSWALGNPSSVANKFCCLTLCLFKVFNSIKIEIIFEMSWAAKPSFYHFFTFCNALLLEFTIVLNEKKHVVGHMCYRCLNAEPRYDQLFVNGLSKTMSRTVRVHREWTSNANICIWSHL